jgi:hypothetical protein
MPNVNSRVFFVIAAFVVVGILAYMNRTTLFRERYENAATVGSDSESTAIAASRVSTTTGTAAAPKENSSMMRGASVSDSTILNPSDMPGPFEGCPAKQKELSPEDLLPKDMNSKWAQANPAGQGMLMDRNFLDAGHHIGINTVGQTLRNANYNLRSEIPNPQIKVSPWMQSTIDPDVGRKPLEIGAGA